MDIALPQKFPFILDRNLATANCTGTRVCMSCDTVASPFFVFIFCGYFNTQLINPFIEFLITYILYYMQNFKYTFIDIYIYIGVYIYVYKFEVD